jgi:hypothetical protein
MHPARTLKNAVTPRPVKQMRRAVYTVTNPLGAAENALIGAALYGGRSRRRSSSRSSSSRTASPASWSSPSRAPAVSTVQRASEAQQAAEQLVDLFAVQRQRFEPARRVQVPIPEPTDPSPVAVAEWERRKHEAHWWQRSRRQQLRSECNAVARAHAAAVHARALADAASLQRQADDWWAKLIDGDAGVLRSALVSAFVDNPAPVHVAAAEKDQAELAVLLPQPSVLPDKQPYITPGGKLSRRAWTQTAFNDAYAELLAAHLLATVRESWAVAPSLQRLRVVGVRVAQGNVREYLFDVDVDRAAGDSAYDNGGEAILARASCGLNRKGRTREVVAWPVEQLRDGAQAVLRNV